MFLRYFYNFIVHYHFKPFLLRFKSILQFRSLWRSSSFVCLFINRSCLFTFGGPTHRRFCHTLAISPLKADVISIGWNILLFCLHFYVIIALDRHVMYFTVGFENNTFSVNMYRCFNHPFITNVYRPPFQTFPPSGLSPAGQWNYRIS